MSIIYLCEKHDQAEKVADVLGVVRKGQGYIEAKGGIVVTWASGHLLSLFNPEDYSDDYKSWQCSLPIVPSPFKQKISNDYTAKQVKVISELVKACSHVVICTDPDREGELIAYELLWRFGYKGSIERAWFASLSPSGIKQALSSLLPGKSKEALATAAYARSQADWLVGMNLTRAMSRKMAGYKTILSVGRVQTPTVAIVVRREREILNFTPRDYYEIVADVSTPSHGSVSLRHAPQGDDRLFDRKEAERIASRVKGATAPIKAVEAKKKTPPPAFYALDTLQKDANRKFGWDAAKTLDIAQSLYSTRSVLTYPRTDCPYLPDDFDKDAAGHISLIATLPELSGVASSISLPIIRKKSHYNSGSLGSHHGITLTGADPSGLSGDERDLFLMVAKRFLAAHMPDYEYLSSSLEWETGGASFAVRGQVPVLFGWKEAYGAGVGKPKADDDEEEEGNGKTLPKIPDGTIGTGVNAVIEDKKTTPPSRYSEADLLDAMKNAARYVSDPNAKARLKATSGIGTSATQGAIIKAIKARGFIYPSKGKLHPSDGAMTFISAVERVIPCWADPAVTAEWEDVMEEIANGKGQLAPFIAGVVQQLRTDVATIDALTIAQEDKITFTQDGSPVKSSGGYKGGYSKSGGGSWKGKGGKGKSYSKPSGGSYSGSGSYNAKSGGSSTGTKAPSSPGASRVDLKVPYDKKDQAKGLGARWDGDKKTWYVPDGIDHEPFRQAGFL